MPLPADTATVLQFMGYTPLTHFSVMSTREGVVIDAWDEAATGRAQPTEQEILDAHQDLIVVGGLTYSRWVAQRAHLAVKDEADRRIAALFGEAPRSHRLVVAEINALARSLELLRKPRPTPAETAEMDENEAMFTGLIQPVRTASNEIEHELNALAASPVRTPEQRRADIAAYVAALGVDEPAGGRTIPWPA